MRMVSFAGVSSPAFCMLRQSVRDILGRLRGRCERALAGGFVRRDRRCMIRGFAGLEIFAWQLVSLLIGVRT